MNIQRYNLRSFLGKSNDGALVKFDDVEQIEYEYRNAVLDELAAWLKSVDGEIAKYAILDKLASMRAGITEDSSAVE